jgi:uncharacterized protein YdaU (DUF1376 family)
MADLDWFPVEPGRYLKNTLHLTARQHGAYWLWIFAAFEARGDLPGTDAGLMAIGKLTAKEWKEDGPILKAFLTREGDKWVHEYAKHLRIDAEARVAAKRKAGQEGARRLWDGRRKGKANGSAMAPPSDSQRQTDAQLQGERQVNVTTTLPATPSYAHALPDDWEPREADVLAAKTARPDLTDEHLAKETVRFRNHAKANNRVAFNWGPNWVNWIMKAEAPKGAGKPTMQTMGDENWSGRMKGWRESSFWMPTWGPEPGQPGCFVPKEFLQ